MLSPETQTILNMNVSIFTFLVCKIFLISMQRKGIKEFREVVPESSLET